MATVIRPPFWVPRPSDDFIAPLLLIPQQTPTVMIFKSLSPLLAQAPMYVPRPPDDFMAPILLQPEPVPITLILKALSPLLAQSPIYVPRPPDDWPWLFPGSQAIPQTLHIAQAPILPDAFLFRGLYYDDSSHYLIDQPQQANTLLPILTAGGKVKQPVFRTYYSYDDASHFLIPQPQQSNILLPILTAGGQPPQRQYSAFVVDDQPVWWGSPLNSDALYMLVEKGAPFHRDWLPWETLDDPAVWTGSPLHSSTVPFFTVGGQPPTKVYAFFPADDAAAWWGSPLNSDALYMLVEKGKPFFKSWSFNVNDDPAVWTGSSLHSSTVPFFTVGGQPPTKRYSFFPSDDPPSWQQTIYRNLGMALITPEPYIPLLARFVSYDDPAFWQGNPLHSWIIPELTQQTPSVPLISRFVSNDDAAVWTGSPLRSDTISALTAGGQPPELIFRYGSYDDAAFWQQTTYRNQIALVPGPTPFVPLISRFASYDDPAFWYAAPVASNTLPILIRGGAPAVPLLDRFVSYDDAAVWLASPVASETLPLLIRGGAPAVPLISRFVSYDDPAFWQATIYRDLALLIPPTPVTPRFWRFGQDDATIWMGHPYISNVILDLTAGGKPFSVMYQSGAVQGNYDTAETAWQFETPFNVSLTTALPHPPFNNQAAFFNQGMAFATDDAAFWVWVPPRSWAMIMPAPPVTVVPPQHPTPYNATVNFGKMGSG